MADALSELESISREFGPDARRRRKAALATLCAGAIPRGPRLGRLEDALSFLRAHPDDGRILSLATRLIERLPGTARVEYPFSHDQARRLAQLHPGALEVDWDAVDDEAPLIEGLGMLVTAGERQALDDPATTLQEWLRACRTEEATTDLEVVLSLLEQSPLPPRAKEHLYERAWLPLVARLTPRSRLRVPAPRETAWQPGPLEKLRGSVEPVIREPLPSVVHGGQEWLDAAFEALAVRRLELPALLHASSEDVHVVELGRGLRIMLAGMTPEHRSALETSIAFLVARNDVPIAYGPAGIFMGACELGINVFPEFRGSDVRRVDAELMRCLHHLCGADAFFLTRYAMGEDNDDALRSGAFWFYRKLGFRATNPVVERLARREERRMAGDPAHRSSPATLRRLSHTEAVLDLSGGRSRLTPFGRLGLLESAFIARRFGGDRERAVRECGRRVGALLGTTVLGGLGPLLAMIPRLSRWTTTELSRLALIAERKQRGSDLEAARLFARHDRLRAALEKLVASG